MVVPGEEFLADITTIWTRKLAPLAAKSLDILEIGSFEGASAIRFLTILPRSTVTCVDPFTGDALGGDSYNGDVATIETRFDGNTAPFGSRVRKLKSRSVPALEALARAEARFDIIYIDGSHVRDDILVDSLLAWPLLADQGLLMWDDYRGGSTWPKAQRPKRAIETFLSLHPDHELVHVGYQLFARKVARGSGFNQFPRPVRNFLRRRFN